ncbi:hypothetical protein [Caldivirga sp. UBA161]|uniref:hypothetical protein n=1 Tax=Caldivirga sp. UBA161 TaxID=1915569 RepID=UPI0025BB3962|nr:hypothetical protein [Caldivirga sp. UBA161]
MGNEELNVKELLELRRRIRERINELRDELSMLESTLKVIDSLIRTRSITTADKVSPKGELRLTAPSGEEVAKLTYDDDKIMVEFSKPITEQPPLRRFFIEKVLNGLKGEDEELINNGELDESMGFDYEVERNSEGLITRVIIRNYREQRRLKRIIDALKWTVSKMGEKQGSETSQ